MVGLRVWMKLRMIGMIEVVRRARDDGSKPLLEDSGGVHLQLFDGYSLSAVRPGPGPDPSPASFFSSSDVRVIEIGRPEVAYGPDGSNMNARRSADCALVVGEGGAVIARRTKRYPSAFWATV